MRDVLTALAIGCILLLSAALIGPYVVDWNAYRGEAARLVSAAIGRPAVIRGDLKVRLLPTPSVSAGNVVIGESDGRGRLQVRSLSAEVSLPALLRGEFEVIGAVLDGPVADLPRFSMSPASKPPGVGSPESATKVTIRQLTVVDGRMVDANGADVAQAIAGDLEITDLKGPMKGSFRFWSAGQPRSIRVSLGTLDAARRMRMRGLLEDEALAARLEADGQLVFAEDGGMGYEGQLTASGNLAMARGQGFTQVLWRASGVAKATHRGALVEAVEVKLGTEPLGVTFGGSLDIGVDPRLIVRATLAARQIDVDRLLGDPERPAPQVPAELVQTLAGRFVQSETNVEWPWGLLDVSVGTLLVGGEPIGGIRLAVESGAQGLKLVTVEGTLPGRTNVTAAPGTIAAGNSLRVSAETRDARRLSTWFHGSQQQVAPFQVAAISGEATIYGDGIRFGDAALTLDGSRMNGTVSFGRVGEGAAQRPRIEAVLRSDLLDIVTLPRLVVTDSIGPDLDLTIDAARVQYQGIGTGRIFARIFKEAAVVRVEKLSVADLGGASVEASGQWRGDASEFRADVDATRLEALGALLQRVVPASYAEPFRQRAAHLSPLRLSITGRQTGEEPAAERVFAINGWLANTRIQAEARLDSDGRLLPGQSLTATFNSGQSGQFLRQLGMEAVSLASVAGSDVKLSVSGDRPREAVTIALSGSLAGADFSTNGQMAFGLESLPQFNGRLVLGSRDISGLAQTLLFSVPTISPGTNLALQARLGFSDLKVTLAEIFADVGGQPVRGELAFNLLEFGRIAGRMTTGRLDARAFSPIVLGDAAQAGLPDTTPFQAMQPPMLPGDVWIEAEEIVLTDEMRLREPRFVFRFERGLIFVDHATARLADGRLEAQLTLRRAARQVQASGRVTLADVRMERLLSTEVDASGTVSPSGPPVPTTPGPPRAGQTAPRNAPANNTRGGGTTRAQTPPRAAGAPGPAPAPVPASVAGGRVSGTVEMSSSGDSLSALAAQVSGVGRLAVADAVLPNFDTDALTRLLRTFELDSARVDVGLVARLLQEQLARNALVVPRVELPLSINAGSLRAGPLSLSREPAVDLTVTADLWRGVMEARAQITDARTPKDWPGASPQASVFWRGPVRNPERSLEVAPLVNGLTALALARELERIELVEQDARERAFFLRRQRASQEERRRNEEEARRVVEERRREDLRREEQRREELRRRDEEDRIRRQLGIPEPGRLPDPALSRPPLPLAPPG